MSPDPRRLASRLRSESGFRSPSRLRSESGFSLLEALLATLILSLGLIGVTNLLALATASHTAARVETAATGQSAEVLERLRTLRFGALQPGGSLDTDTGTVPGCEDGPDQDCVFPGNFNLRRDVPGVGPIKTRWFLPELGATSPTCFIVVQSEGESAVLRGRTRVQLTTVRTCLAGAGCGTGC
jgi:type II secretory pathway pseudopilin PulG